MATIGTFTQTEDGAYTGSIKTLTLNVKSVQFRRNEKTHENSPDYRIFSGDTQLGTARMRTSKRERPYLSVTLDDPSFSSTIFAALVPADEGHNLVWSRPRKAA
ncbi:DUF736 domain-containing protein [Phenylobacterium sp.]|uniref:DUF736 domain-containing protein n=1 Tax=Phenylobacterium sp. TaxID=1871053 RepID=UPI002F42C28D